VAAFHCTLNDKRIQCYTLSGGDQEGIGKDGVGLILYDVMFFCLFLHGRELLCALDACCTDEYPL